MTKDKTTDKSLHAGNGNVDLAESEITHNSEPNNNKESPLPAAPDGGWGWVVCLSSFVISFLVDGVCFSFGIFFPSFLEYFGESKGKTAVIGSVLNGAYLTVGPIVGVLANKYGCRAVAVTGSIVAAIGLFGSAFSPNLDVMILLFGGIGGIGFGFMYLPAIVMVGYYFDKKRAFATGIAVCGSGIGNFVFAPFCEYLLHEYNWKGVSWILAGLVLNGVVFALFFRPLEIKTEKSVTRSKCKTSVAMVTIDNEVRTLSPSDFIINDQCAIYRCRSVEIDKCCSDSHVTRLAFSQDILSTQGRKRQKVAHAHRDVLKPLAKKDIFYSGSLRNIPHNLDSRNEREVVSKTTDLKESLVHLEDDNVVAKSVCAKVKHFCASSFDVTLLMSPTFLIYGTSCFLCMFGFFIPFNFLPDLAKDMNLSSHKGALLISLIGVTNTVTRIVVGYVSDRPWADALIINNVSLMLGGAATIAVPLLQYFEYLVVYTVVFGAAIAAFVSLRSIIMVDLMGIEKLTNAFGLVVLCQGLSSFIGSPIAGSLSDSTGTYDVTFYLAGATIFMAGFICLPLRRISRWENNKQTKTKSFLNGSSPEQAPMLGKST